MHTHAHADTRTHMQAHTRTHAGTRVHTWAQMRMHTRTHMHTGHTRAHTRTHAGTHGCTRAHTGAHMDTRVHIWMHTHAYAGAYTDAHVGTHADATRTHTQTRVAALVNKNPGQPGSSPNAHQEQTGGRSWPVHTVGRRSAGGGRTPSGLTRGAVDGLLGHAQRGVPRSRQGPDAGTREGEGRLVTGDGSGAPWVRVTPGDPFPQTV